MNDPASDASSPVDAPAARSRRVAWPFGMGRRRRPAPSAHPVVGWGFPLLLVVAGVFVFVLWREGAKAVLDTTDGTDVVAVTDPTEPGFLAFAEPTPTLLVAHTDADDQLIGVTVLARTSLDAGGSLVVFSADMLLDLEGDADPVLHELYAVEGAEGLERVIGEWLGFGFTDPQPTTMEPERLLAFLELVEPLPLFLADPLVRVGDDGGVETVYPSGTGSFSAAEAVEIYGWRNPSESDYGMTTRQLAIWESWLVRIGEADDLIATTLPFNEGPPPYLRALGTGTAVLDTVPAVPVPFDPERPLYVLPEGQQAWPRSKGREMVPLPVAWAPGVWPTVQLLDGTGEATNRSRFVPVVAEAGAEITVIGNATAFGVAETYVAYHLEDDAAAAEALGAALGVPVRFEEDLDQPAQLTVTVGLDSADL